MNIGDIVTIEGEIVRTWGQVKSSGWTWFDVMMKGKVCRVSGCIPQQVCEGMTVSCECKVVDNGQYGIQYKLCGAMNVNVLTRKAIQVYLSQVSGIGVKTIDKLYNAFGKDTISMIENDFDTVCQKVSLTSRQKDALSHSCVLQPEMRLLKRFPSLMNKASMVWEHFRKRGTLSVERLIDKIEQNPFVLTHLCSFAMMDDILIKDLGEPLDSVRRMSFVISYYMTYVLRDYHITYISTADEFDELAEYVFTGTRRGQKPSNRRPMADSVINGVAMYGSAGMWLFQSMCARYHDGKWIRIDRRKDNVYHFYTERVYRAKTHLVEQLVGLIGRNYSQDSFYLTNGVKFDDWWKHGSKLLNSDQKNAVKTSVTNKLSFISGGPGRGKTFTAGSLRDFWLCHYKHVMMLAPTGRAANKLKMETGHRNTGTIARFVQMNLEYRNDGCVRNICGDEMPCDARTLVIVDEVSMLDFVEAVDLLNKLMKCTIVFMGDIYQLAPIEPGCFLAEVLKVNDVYPLPISMLNKNMRTNVAVLAENADKVLNGTLSPRDYDDNFQFDFTFCGDTDGQQIMVTDADALTCEKAYDYYKNFLSKGYAISDIMVIAPTWSGNAGTTALNRYFQERENVIVGNAMLCVDKHLKRECYVAKGYVCGGFVLDGIAIRIGDRLMNTKNDGQRGWYRFENNNPDCEIVEDGTGFFNGDVCTVIRYYPMGSHTEPAMILVQTDDGRTFFMACDYESYGNLCFGYALTVHKAQGSEAKCVILVLPEHSVYSQHWFKVPFLTKNLIYTAVTRAKETVCILGSKNALDMGLQTEQEVGRSTVADDVLRNIAQYQPSLK